MKLTTVFPVITTEKLEESRDFYVQHLGFSVVFEQDWYVHLANGDFQLAFMQPDHPSQPPLFRSAHSGSGMILSFELEDAAEAFETFQRKQLDIELPLTREPWGELHFALKDPNGIAVNITQMVEATDEYKAAYSVA